MPFHLFFCLSAFTFYLTNFKFFVVIFLIIFDTCGGNSPSREKYTKNTLFCYFSLGYFFILLTRSVHYEIWVTLAESFCSRVMPGSELDAKVGSPSLSLFARPDLPSPSFLCLKLKDKNCLYDCHLH
jgi:hypothetical protein